MIAFWLATATVIAVGILELGHRAEQRARDHSDAQLIAEQDQALAIVADPPAWALRLVGGGA